MEIPANLGTDSTGKAFFVGFILVFDGGKNRFIFIFCFDVYVLRTRRSSPRGNLGQNIMIYDLAFPFIEGGGAGFKNRSRAYGINCLEVVH